MTHSEVFNQAIEGTRVILNRLTPRTEEDRLKISDLSHRLIEILMDTPAEEDTAPQVLGDVKIIKGEALSLMTTMGPPKRVLLFQDFNPKETSFLTEGDCVIRIHKNNTLDIPHGTRITIHSLAAFLAIIHLPGGLELTLDKKNFPPDGIPVQGNSNEKETSEENL